MWKSIFLILSLLSLFQTNDNHSLKGTKWKLNTIEDPSIKKVFRPNIISYLQITDTTFSVNSCNMIYKCYKTSNDTFYVTGQTTLSLVACAGEYHKVEKYYLDHFSNYLIYQLRHDSLVFISNKGVIFRSVKN